MATKPTPGGSDGTYGTELNAHLDVSIASDGKIKDGAEQTSSAAPTADAQLANMKYVDDQIVTIPSASLAAKAWCKVNAAGVLQGSGYNISSTSRSSEGIYVVSWDTDFADTNYVVVVTVIPSDFPQSFIANAISLATGSATIKLINLGGDSYDGDFMVVAFGTQ